MLEFILCGLFVFVVVNVLVALVLYVKVRLSKMNLKQLRIIVKQFKKVELDEDNELEMTVAEEMMEYIDKRIKKLEKLENE